MDMSSTRRYGMPPLALGRSAPMSDRLQAARDDLTRETSSLSLRTHDVAFIPKPEGSAFLLVKGQNQGVCSKPARVSMEVIVTT